MGAIVAVIGLELMPTAANMAGLTGENTDATVIFVSIATLAITIFASMAFRGFLSKGSKVAIEGKLRFSSWETKEGQCRAEVPSRVRA